MFHIIEARYVIWNIIWKQSFHALWRIYKILIFDLSVSFVIIFDFCAVKRNYASGLMNVVDIKVELIFLIIDRCGKLYRWRFNAKKRIFNTFWKQFFYFQKCYLPAGDVNGYLIFIIEIFYFSLILFIHFNKNYRRVLIGKNKQI